MSAKWLDVPSDPGNADHRARRYHPVVAWFGANPCFWLDSLSFVISAAMISSISIHRERSGCSAEAFYRWLPK